MQAPLQQVSIWVLVYLHLHFWCAFLSILPTSSILPCCARTDTSAVKCAAVLNLSSCLLLVPGCSYISTFASTLYFPFHLTYPHLNFCPAAQCSHQCSAAVFHLSSCSLLIPGCNYISTFALHYTFLSILHTPILVFALLYSAATSSVQQFSIWVLVHFL